MPAKQNKLAMCIVVSLLAAVLLPTAATQALAQAEQQERESPAREASEPDVIPPPTHVPVTDWGVGDAPVPALESDAVSLVRPEAAHLFPITDAPAESDAAAARAPAAAAVSTTAWVAIVVAAAAVVAVLVFVEPG